MRSILIGILFLLGAVQLSAQCDSTAYLAHKFITDEYISDGQAYRALLFGDQVAEFETTLFGNSAYRIAAFSGTEDDQLIFSMFDEENNLLFTNEDFENAPYWNFETESTLHVRLEAKLDKTKQSSGCAVLLVGFEK